MLIVFLEPFEGVVPGGLCFFMGVKDVVGVEDFFRASE